MKETRFKQREIGLIPEDWKIVNLGSIAKINGRIGFRGYTTADLVTAGQGAYTIGGKHITNMVLDLRDAEYISWEKYYESPEIMVKKGDIVLAQRGTLGKSAFIVKDIGPATINPSLVLINKIKCDNRYLAYWLQSDKIVRYICSINSQTSIPMITQNQIEYIPVALPIREEEQRNIAKVLSKTDALITAIEKTIEKKRLIKQGTMQELLTGKKRLPGFTGDWVEKQLGEISKIYRGGSPRPIENYLTTMNDGINWIKIGDVDKSAKYIYKTQERIKPSGVSSSRYVKSGDFLLSNSMSFGRPYILKTSGCIHDGWLVIQDYQQYCDCDFLYYTLSSNYILQQYKAKAAGSSVLNLNKDIASNVIIKYPKDILEQKAIAKVLSSIDKEIESLEGKKTKYEQIKQGMMQQLLTGKIRLI